MVCGFHPFASDNIATTMDLIAEATISFPSPYWDEVSEAVKDLIVQMLKRDPKERLNAEQCLAHPWISGIAQVPGSSLSSALSAIRRINAKKKLKKVREICTAFCGSEVVTQEDVCLCVRGGGHLNTTRTITCPS